MSRKGKALEAENTKVTLNDEVLTRSRTVKCLGVHIDDGLTWKDHVVATRRKCFGALARIRRLKDVLPVQTKKKIYNALVLPHLDYCSVVWQECSEQLRRRVEGIQNYGMRLILSKPPRTPSAELRSELRWNTLAQRRKLSRLFLVHRSINNQGPEYMNIFLSNAAAGCRATRGSNKLHLNHVSTEINRRSFKFKGAQDWNALPEDIRSVQSADTFKRLLKLYYVQNV